MAVQSTPSTPAIQSEGTTLLLHLDHMNDPKGYCALLCDWSRQLSISGPLFVPFDERHQSLTDTKRRPRHVLAVLDCTSPDGGKEFLRRLRTQNVDVTVRGQPCKERMSTVVAELALSDDGFPAEAAPARSRVDPSRWLGGAAGAHHRGAPLAACGSPGRRRHDHRHV